jgi:drug/metabolite transporter (DMT)-like permease
MPRAVLLSTAMQMLTGGALLLVVGLLIGEGAHFDVSAVTRRSAIAWLYLVGFGSIVGYTAYIWLLDNVSSARASTYAYVNPVVAVALGWALAGEVVTSRTLVAAAVIVAAVAIIVTARKPATQPIAAGDQTPLPARAARREDRLLATDER